MTGYINPPLGWVFVVCGLLGALLIAVRTWGPQLKRFLPRRSTTTREPLQLVSSVRDLEVPPHLPGDRQLFAALDARPRFAVVAVTNDHQRPVTVVPQVYVDGEERPGAGAWAEEPGDTFTPVTAAGMQFNVGATRLLIVAVAFGTINPAAIWYPVRSRDDASFHNDMTKVMARGLRLGSSPELRVRLRAERVDQSITLPLGFSADGEPILKPPVAPPRSKAV